MLLKAREMTSLVLSAPVSSELPSSSLLAARCARKRSRMSMVMLSPWRPPVVFQLFVLVVIVIVLFILVFFFVVVCYFNLETTGVLDEILIDRAVFLGWDVFRVAFRVLN